MNEKFKHRGSEILDILFNTSSQSFITKAGIVSGMRVLEIGCGSGLMGCWLAEQVGPEGFVLGIDNNPTHLIAGRVRAESKQLKNIHFQQQSAYELINIHQKFDFIFCRFVLNYLQYPMEVMRGVFELLNFNGIFVCEEGIASSAFAYPYSETWGVKRWSNHLVLDDLENQSRDYNLGMKLVHKILSVGFKINHTSLVQPLLSTQEQKELVWLAMIEDRQSLLEEQYNDMVWKIRARDFKQVVENELQTIAFYQSCQVAATKPGIINKIESSRIQFSQLKISDTQKVFELFESDRHGKLSIFQVEMLLIHSNENFKKHNIGLFGIALKNNSNLIGMGGFEFSSIEGMFEMLMIIKLSTPYFHDIELLTEIALALHHHVFDKLKLTRFVFLADPMNKTLINLANKIGMRQEKMVVHHGQIAILFAIERN